MKKYIISLFLFGFLLTPLLSLAEDTDPNISSDCVSLQSTNLRYKSRDANTNGEVSTLQDFLQSKSYLNNEPTGYFGLLTQKAVKSFQSANSINSTGYVGSITRAKIKSLTCDETITNNPVISGVSGPQTLNVNQRGEWTVKASDSSAENLSYFVLWGDEGPGMSMQSGAPLSQTTQTATFGHTYTTARTYNPKFTVTNTSGQSVSASLSVKVGDTATPSITVLSPNGGETIELGQKTNISWKQLSLNDSNVSISLKNDNIICSETIVGCQSQYHIDTIKNTGNYLWDTNNKMSGPSTGPNSLSVVPGLKYKILICDKSGNICDSSDNYFKIVSPITTQLIESGDDVNGKHIGYIKSISSQNGVSSLAIDYVQYISPCVSNPLTSYCMNGYEVVNNNTLLRTFPISNNVQVKLQTYSHDASGNFVLNQIVPLSTLTTRVNSNSANYLYWITLNSGNITDITEQYQP